MAATLVASSCSVARSAHPDRRSALLERRTVRGEEPQHLLTLSEIRRTEAALSPTLPASFRKISCWGRPGRGHMLFRVGRTFAVVSCISAVAIEFAAAADIPYVTSPAPVDVLPSWAGFYLGGQVGYGGDSVRWRNLGASAFFSPLNSVTRDRGSGVIGGGQLGYNFQYNRLVFGIDGSASAADFDRSFASPYFPATDVWSSRLTWLTTVTGRVGYGFDNWLPYVKGGFAAGNVETSIQSNAF